MAERGTSAGFVFVIAAGAAVLAGVAGGCGPAQPAGGPGSGAGSAKAFDQCDKSPPLAKKYVGLLKDARCDYDRFPIMADVGKMLGVECKYCHAPDPDNAKEELYPVMTPRKEIANWMGMHLMTAIKPKDGSALTCKSCHVDEDGKPVAKILGEPRDARAARDWMSDVMVTKFVVAKTGEKLKCAHCHMGTFDSPTWQAKVILTDHLPAH